MNKRLYARRFKQAVDWIEEHPSQWATHERCTKDGRMCVMGVLDFLDNGNPRSGLVSRNIYAIWPGAVPISTNDSCFNTQQAVEALRRLGREEMGINMETGELL